MEAIKGKQLALLFFSKKDCAGDRWTCNACNAHVVQSSSGYTNLCHHVNAHHKGMIGDRLRQKTKRPREFFHTLSYSTKTQAAFAWLECVIMTLQPFSFCEKNVIRRHFRHSSISVDSLMRYMDRLTTIVEDKIKELLPDRFAVIFDGWSGADTHYASVFATFPTDRPCGFDSVLLSIAPMRDEDSLSAEEHYEFLKFVLSVYDKTLENVVAVVGDNANTNRAFARRVGPIFVGCHSHRFNLAVNDILAKYDTIIEKVHVLIKKMSFQIAAAKLRKLTHLRPKVRNYTRWSSTFEMMQRYIKLRDFVARVDLPDVLELCLTADEDNEVERLCRILGDLDSITKALQSPNVSLSDARALLDGAVERHPAMRSRLGVRSNLVENVSFESAVCKVQSGDEHALSAAERKAVQNLLICDSLGDTERTNSDNLSFSELLLKRRRLKTAPTNSRYVYFRFILATSNICERLFFVAGFSIGSRRMGALPTSLEAQLFLNVNSTLWGISEVQPAAGIMINQLKSSPLFL